MSRCCVPSGASDRRAEMRFAALFRPQRRRLAPVLAAGATVALVVPLLSVRGTGTGLARPDELLASVQAWGYAYPLLAAGLGVLVALAVWSADVRGRHVHALSLPIARPHYVLLRYAVGLTLLAVPVAALLVGALLAAVLVPRDPGLQTYALWLTLRFALATTTAYSLVFAASTATRKTALLLLVLVMAVVGAQIAAGSVPLLRDGTINLLELLQSDAGPLGLFAGRWMLVDV